VTEDAGVDEYEDDRAERPNDGFVFFPPAQVVAEIAKIEAAQPTPAMTFSWARSIGFALLFALAGGALYAAIVVAINMQLGLVSIVIGAFAGLGAARGGRGRRAQAIGAIAAAVGYYAGLVMAVAVTVGVDNFLKIPFHYYGTLLVTLVKGTFSGMDALFLGIAVYQGWIIPRGAQK
jgi:hypothetical protein